MRYTEGTRHPFQEESPNKKHSGKKIQARVPIAEDRDSKCTPQLTALKRLLEPQRLILKIYEAHGKGTQVLRSYSDVQSALCN